MAAQLSETHGSFLSTQQLLGLGLAKYLQRSLKSSYSRRQFSINKQQCFLPSCLLNSSLPPTESHLTKYSLVEQDALVLLGHLISRDPICQFVTGCWTVTG